MHIPVALCHPEAASYLSWHFELGSLHQTVNGLFSLQMCDTVHSFFINNKSSIWWTGPVLSYQPNPWVVNFIGLCTASSRLVNRSQKIANENYKKVSHLLYTGFLYDLDLNDFNNRPTYTNGHLAVENPNQVDLVTYSDVNSVTYFKCHRYRIVCHPSMLAHNNI